ncbi:MAG: YhjD/YihY/BrkB family envelope integrity protein [Microlunatus sp.]
MTVTDRVRERTERVRERVQPVQTRVQRILAIGWIAHVRRAVQRYNGRFGFQFGAGVAYFSVLAIVPVLMVAFSILGFFLVELRPDLITTVSQLVTDQLRGVSVETLEEIEHFVLGTLQNYTSIGVAGLIAGLYTAAAWMGHLRNAIDAQWRLDFDAERDTTPYAIKVVVNLGRMGGLLVAIAVTFGLATISTNFAQQIAGWLGFGNTWFTSALPRILAPFLSLAAGWLTFCYIYLVVPRRREVWRYVRIGALFGGIGLFILQYGTALIIGAISGNKAALVFGPVIGLMLFFNLFAQLILIIAAWIATAHEPAFQPPDEGVVRFAVRPAAPVTDVPATVTEENATRAVRVGLGAGWLAGTATGLGLGAILAWIASRFGRRLSGRRSSR